MHCCIPPTAVRVRMPQLKLTTKRAHFSEYTFQGLLRILKIRTHIIFKIPLIVSEFSLVYIRPWFRQGRCVKKDADLVFDILEENQDWRIRSSFNATTLLVKSTGCGVSDVTHDIFPETIRSTYLRTGPALCNVIVRLTRLTTNIKATKKRVGNKEKRI
jgi:hypothetical protein